MALQQTDENVKRLGLNRWRGVRIYECPVAEAELHAHVLWDTTLSDYGGGRYSPVATRVWRRDKRPSTASSTIVVWYETLDWDSWLERNPGHGVRFIRSSLSGRLPKQDLNGRVIDGYDYEDTTGRVVWKQVAGKLTIPEPRGMIRVYSMTRNQGMITSYLDHVGSVSSTYMTHFGPFSGSGESMLWSLRSTPRLGDPGIEAVTYDFLCLDGGWNNSIESRKHEMQVVESPVKDYLGVEISGVYERFATMVPTSTTRTASVFKTANFSAINALLGWYL